MKNAVHRPKLSPLVSVHFCEDKSLLTHCGSLESILVPDWVGRCLLALESDSAAAEEIDDEFLDTLHHRGFLCEGSRSQDEEIKGELGSLGIATSDTAGKR